MESAFGGGKGGGGGSGGIVCLDAGGGMEEKREAADWKGESEGSGLIFGTGLEGNGVSRRGVDKVPTMSGS